MNSQSKFAKEDSKCDVSAPESQSQSSSVKKPRIYNRKCVLKSCNYVAPNGFFGFPKNEKIKKKWLDACCLDENEVKSRDQLCYQHFDDRNIISRTQNAHHPRLRLGVVPTLNLPKVC